MPITLDDLKAGSKPMWVRKKGCYNVFGVFVWPDGSVQLKDGTHIAADGTITRPVAAYPLTDQAARLERIHSNLRKESNHV